MTLREFLVKQQTRYTGDVLGNFHGSDKERHKSMGKVFACTDIIDLLSDESLDIEVETRAEAAAKARKNTTCCRYCCQCKKGE